MWFKIILPIVFICFAAFSHYAFGADPLKLKPDTRPLSTSPAPQLTETELPKPLRTPLELKRLKIQMPSLCQSITSIHAALNQKKS